MIVLDRSGEEGRPVDRDRSYLHRGGSTPLLGRTIPEHFRAVAELFPGHEAIVSLPQHRRLTYAQLKTAVDKLARGLLAAGFDRGDRVGIWATNNIEWVLLQLATARAGIVLVNINPALRENELVYALKRAAVQGLFMIPAFRQSHYIEMLLQRIPELRQDSAGSVRSEEFPDLRCVVLYEPAAPEKTQRPCPGFTVWPEILEMGAAVSDETLERRTASLDMDDAINIQYTSGTTGYPKAVVLTHHNILNNAFFSARSMRFSEVDRLCVPVPFYHCFGMVLGNLLCFSVGACVVVACDHFDPLSVLQAVATERCTAIHGVPTMFVAELEHPQFRDFDLTTLRTGIMAGAPCPATLMRRVMGEMHCGEILIGYGQTEASPLTHLTDPDDSLEHRTETVGRNLPHQEVKVVDVNTGATLPYKETGEICFRGYHIMREYFGDAAATREAIDENGWLHSGDLGLMEAEGYVRITGRLKEMIIRGGENIYPAEIEECIFDHPKVSQVAVFGVADAYYGEEVMAWVMVQAGQTLTEEELRDYCRRRLAHFKVPRYIWMVEAFPMTVTGKLQKYRMREIAMQKLAEGSKSR